MIIAAGLKFSSAPITVIFGNIKCSSLLAHLRQKAYWQSYHVPRILRQGQIW